MRRFAILTLLLLTACGPAMVESDVTRFSSLPAGGGARSFTILPDASQKGSLEFQHYAEMVAAQLAGRGWRPQPDSGAAAAVVLVRWGLGPPAPATWSEPAPMGDGWGPGPWNGPPPSGTVYARTEWPKWLEVEVVDGPAWRAGDKRGIWQGRAVTGGSLPGIAPAMPALVRALFTGFPGGNGDTVHVAVPAGN